MKKRRILSLVVCIMLTLTTFMFNTNTAHAWTLAWSDEFNGTSLDGNKWVCEIGTGSNGWGNNELEYYTSRPENVSVGGGNLQITARRESYGGKSFTSARLKTQGKYSFQYGKIEARIKLPYGKGMWPAFWMLGNSISSVGWPKCGEVDIMEMAGGQNDRMTYSTCHWDNAGSYAGYGKTYTHWENLSNAFHTYEVEWNSTYIITRFDGVEYYRIDITPAELSEFRAPYFILLNLAVGGNFFSPAITDPTQVTAPLPQTMLVDYVRVYK